MCDRIVKIKRWQDRLYRRNLVIDAVFVLTGGTDLPYFKKESFNVFSNSTCIFHWHHRSYRLCLSRAGNVRPQILSVWCSNAASKRQKFPLGRLDRILRKNDWFYETGRKFCLVSMLIYETFRYSMSCPLPQLPQGGNVSSASSRVTLQLQVVHS